MIAGTLSKGFIFSNDDDHLVETAHHEAAHALRAHHFGVQIKAICLGWRGWNSHTELMGDASIHPWSTHAQVALAGPACSLRYLRENPHIVIFSGGRGTFGERENPDDLLKSLFDIRWESDDKESWFKYSDLTPDIFVECELAKQKDIDDIHAAFHDVLVGYYNRRYRIPRPSTLLRYFVEQETIAHQWVADNWLAISDLAAYLLKQEGNKTRHTHRLPGQKFDRWLKMHEVRSA